LIINFAAHNGHIFSIGFKSGLLADQDKEAGKLTLIYRALALRGIALLLIKCKSGKNYLNSSKVIKKKSKTFLYMNLSLDPIKLIKSVAPASEIPAAIINLKGC